MEGSSKCYDTQIIDGEGNYNVDSVTNFMADTNLSDRGHSYSVVAILGPQHGGKSTIMNHLFGTNFKQMYTSGRRRKTTDGIWIAKCAGIDDPFIIAMDMEGTDGRERGEGDTAFEKQSSVFGLAVADVVMINMWCHDLGRENAANKPLLKIVFEVRMRMHIARKVTLLVVLRDKTQGDRFESLKADVEQDLQEIWGTVTKRHPDHKHNFSKYFHVEVVALSNYHDKREIFEEEVAQMRQQYFGSNLLQRGGDAADRLPASEFAFSTKQIWDAIKQNKDLDLPAHRVMIETFRCNAIADEKFGLLSNDKGWLELKKAVKAGPVSRFGRKFRPILDNYLTQFDKETMYFDEGIKNMKGQELRTKAVGDLANPCFLLLINNFRCKAFEDLRILFLDYLDQKKGFGAAIQTCLLEFDEACKDAAMELIEWDTSDARENLRSEVNRQVELLRDSKLSQLETLAKEKLVIRLEAIKSIVQKGGEKTWYLIRECLVKERETALTSFEADIAHLELGEAAFDLQMKSLRRHSINVAEQIVKQEAADVHQLMIDRFTRLFNLNIDGTVRDWAKVGGIKKLSLEARKECLKLLADLAAMRFSGEADKIYDQLYSALVGRSAFWEARVDLAGSKWEEVSSNDTLITPAECKTIWAEFQKNSNHIVAPAKKARRQHKLTVAAQVISTAGTVGAALAAAAVL